MRWKNIVAAQRLSDSPMRARLFRIARLLRRDEALVQIAIVLGAWARIRALREGPLLPALELGAWAQAA
jgi:hypothetical protein